METTVTTPAGLITPASVSARLPHGGMMRARAVGVCRCEVVVERSGRPLRRMHGQPDQSFAMGLAGTLGDLFQGTAVVYVNHWMWWNLLRPLDPFGWACNPQRCSRISGGPWSCDHPRP